MLSESGGIAAGDGRALRRFLIVDSHEPVRRSLSRLIERRPEWKVVGEAGCAIEGLRMARESRPDAAVVDFRLGEIDGVELTLNLAARAPGVRIVGYSFQDDALSMSRFLAAGGHAFVSKHEPPEALIDAIEQALAGRIRISFYENAATDELRSESQSSA